MLRRGPLCAGACLALGLSSPAGALEYCVTCEGPPAMYRCVIEGTPDGPGKDPTASLHCISQMATRGQHETCAVSRGAPFPCPGLTTLVAQPAHAPDLAEPPPDFADLPLDEEPEAAAEAPKPAKVPRTVEELAGQTFQSSKAGLQKAGEAIGGTAKKAGEQIGNAGSAIGSAASKTWNCIISLFSSCGDEAEAAVETEIE